MPDRVKKTTDETAVDPLWNSTQVGQHFAGKSGDALSRFTIDRWVAKGLLPEPIRINGFKRWPRSWVLAAAEKLQQR